MKKNYFLSIVFILFGIVFSQSQNKLSFENSNKQLSSLDKNFKEYKVLTLTDEIKKLSSGEQITINYGQDFTFTLFENKILSSNYILSIKGEKGIERKSIYETNFDGKYFRNEDIAEKNQLIFSYFENSYSIYIKNTTSEFYIEPLKKFDKMAISNEYVFYEVKDVIAPENTFCGVKENQKRVENNKINTENQRIGTCKTVDLAFSIDYTMYSYYNSINDAINRTLEILNLTEANYKIANGISDDVKFKVVEHYLVTCDVCNYWPSTLDISLNYNGLSSNAYRMFVNQYDMKIHWQNQGGPGSIVGLGAYNICNTNLAQNGYGTATVKNYPNDTNFIRCILSHEIGHNFGCQHDSEIMNAYVSGSNSWSPQSIVTINNTFANSSTCMATCVTNTCDNKKVVDALVIPDMINNKINVSWLAETGVDFKVRLYNTLTATWSPYTTFSYPNNTTFYTFSQTHCTDIYRVEITPVCSGIIGISEQIVFSISKNVAAPALSFSSSIQNQTLCGGKLYNFSVISIDGGTTPTYQWKVNGVNAGTNSPTFTSSLLQNNDVLSCNLTSSATCVVSPFASVNKTVTVIAPSVLSNSISSSLTTICAGTSITLTATGTNIQGQYPYYQWFLNGTQISGQGGPIGGTGGLSGPVITVTPLNTGDVYTCQLFDGEGCHTTTGGVMSNSITVTIQNPCILATDIFSISGLEYYPNPIKNEFLITANENLKMVSIFNLLGQKMFSNVLNSYKTVLDFSNLPNAIYFVKIETENQSKIIKVSKD